MKEVVDISRIWIRPEPPPYGFVVQARDGRWLVHQASGLRGVPAYREVEIESANFSNIQEVRDEVKGWEHDIEDLYTKDNSICRDHLIDNPQEGNLIHDDLCHVCRIRKLLGMRTTDKVYKKDIGWVEE